MPIFTERSPLLGEPIAPVSTTGEVFGAMFEEAAESGLFGAGLRTEQIAEARGTQAPTRAETQYGLTPKRRPLSALLSPEQGRQRLRNNGLDQNLSIPQNGIRSAELDILIERKRAELRRDLIMAQANPSYGTLGASLAGSLVGSFVDPSNLALGFVPVVGEARYAQLLARAGGVLGRTGVRAGVGAVEGLVGLLPAEAVNYYANQQQQADYTAYESMLNIAGGAFFGSALHGGAGLMGDAVFGFKPPMVEPPARVDNVLGEVPPARQVSAVTREQVERSIIMERLAQGQPITRAQVDAIPPRTMAEAGMVIDNRISELRLASEGVLPEANVRALVAERDELEALVRGEDKLTVSRLTPAERQFADERRVAIRQELEAHKAAQSAAKQLDTLESRLAKIDDDATLGRLADEILPPPDRTFVESLSPAARAAIESDPLMPVRPFIASLSPDTQARSLRMAISQALEGRPIDVGPAILTDARYLDADAAMTAAARNATEVDGASKAASEAGAKVEGIPTDIDGLKAQVEQDEADLNRMLETMDEDVADEAARALKGIVENGRQQGNAAKAAAMCMRTNE
jgi:hypothetical protein